MTIPYRSMTDDELLREAEERGDDLADELVKRLAGARGEAEGHLRALKVWQESEQELEELEEENEDLDARLRVVRGEMEKAVAHLTTAISKTRL